MIFVVGLLLVSFPGIYAFLKGRAFLRREQNDEFALDYFKYRINNSVILWLCLILFFLFPPILFPGSILSEIVQNYALGLGPLIVFLISYVLFLVGYSLIDRKVRGHQASISVRIRFDLGLLFLMFWPYILLVIQLFGAHSFYWIKATLVIILYLLLYLFTPAFWQCIFGAKPIDDDQLKTDLKTITDKSGMKPVRLFLFSDHGLKYANAFTIGNWRGARAVFMTDCAFTSLEVAEVVAIYAHEIGHFRSNQVVRRSLALTLPLILIAIINTVVRVNSPFIQWGLLAASLLVVKVLVPSQQFEKEADSFALKATLDPQALISALEKIYRLSNLPRHFKPAEETKYTHPSLAQRVKYIKKNLAQELPHLLEPRQFTAAKNYRAVIFNPDSLETIDQYGQKEKLPYSEIFAMYPSKLKDGVLLTVRHKAKYTKISLLADYRDIFNIVDIIEYSFAEYPSVDPSRFKREHRIMHLITAFVGLASAFFAGPALFIIGVTGFFEQNKRFFLSNLAACLIITSMLIVIPLQETDLNRTLLIIYGLLTLLSLYDHLRFRQLDQPEPAHGNISFYTAFIFLVFQIVILIILIAVPVNAYILRTYGIIGLNFTALSLALLLLRAITDRKRAVLVLCNLLSWSATLAVLLMKG